MKIYAKDHPRILKRVKAGETLEAVAKDYGVTREYVRLICKRMGYEGLQSNPERRKKQRDMSAARRLAELEERSDEVEKLWQEGVPVQEIAERLEFSLTTVNAYVHKNYDNHDRRARINQTIRKTSRQFDDEFVIRSMQKAARILGRTPGVNAYMKLRNARIVEGPSAIYIVNRMGWSEACRRAGLVPNKRPGPEMGRTKFSNEDIEQGVKRIAEVVGRAPSIADYKEHYRPGEEITADGIRARHGSWTEYVFGLLGDCR